MIGVFLKGLIKKEAIARALPIAKKVLLDVGKEYVQGAAKTAGEKSVGTITKAPQKVEEFVNKKKSEFLDEAESKAEKVFSDQMEILDQRIDKKVIEIEKKVDEKIKAVFWLFLFSTFVIMILAGLTFSLLLRYFNF
tara:strand:- start:1155 stop:1565 length:411 start_codon:yes stop_codon:yes gene_type:complete